MKPVKTRRTRQQLSAANAMLYNDVALTVKDLIDCTVLKVSCKNHEAHSHSCNDIVDKIPATTSTYATGSIPQNNTRAYAKKSNKCNNKRSISPLLTYTNYTSKSPPILTSEADIENMDILEISETGIEESKAQEIEDREGNYNMKLRHNRQSRQNLRCVLTFS